MSKKANHFFNHWPVIKETFKDKDILLFLDYDGTLTPIVERPESAVLSTETKKVLETLIEHESFKVFIVSGRAMADVKMRVGINNIVYIGNHGLEIEGMEIDCGDFSFPRFRKILEYLKCEINQEPVFLKGAFVEDKGLSLSVHYRMLNLKDESIFRIFFERITKEFAFKNKVRIVSGKKVFEIRPPMDWDKGKAVLQLLKTHEDAIKNQKVVVVYIGDDQTDEDAFKVLDKMAVTIHVGDSQSTAAGYFLESPREVTKFLECLVDLKGKKG